jgi:hypothetical protein
VLRYKDLAYAVDLDPVTLGVSNDVEKSVYGVQRLTCVHARTLARAFRRADVSIRPRRGW